MAPTDPMLFPFNYPNWRTISTSCYLVHLSEADLHPTPSPSMTSFSRSSQVAPPCSRSITFPPVVRSRTPLESNFQLWAFFAHRRRSRSNVVSPDQPRTAQPTV